MTDQQDPYTPEQLADLIYHWQRFSRREDQCKTTPYGRGRTTDAITAEQTAAALQSLQAKCERLEAENERLRMCWPDFDGRQYKATIRCSADLDLDWLSVLYAVHEAADEMEDPEDTVRQVEMPDGTALIVDLDAERGNPPNVYEVRESAGESGDE